jgi:hypothetical protein
MGTMMTTETAVTEYFAGDVVVLVDQVPHRPALKPGLEGVVVIGDEANSDVPWAMVSVEFPRLTPHCWQLHRRHLRLMERAPADGDADADADA